jgi:Ca2+-binding EF-hand superfamily protein
MESIAGLGDKSHNPFQQVLQKLELFVENNNLKPSDLLKRVGASSSDGVTLEKFAQFLK